MNSYGKNKHTKRRTERIEIRLTEQERIDLNTHAEIAGAEVSEYVRSKIFGTVPRKHSQATGERAELIKALGELGKIGSNVNQIARALNRDVVPDPWMIETATKEIENLGHYLRAVLHGH